MTTLTQRNGTGLDLRHPKGELNRLFDEVDAILNRSLRPFGRSGLWSDAFTPLADIEETDDAWIVEAEVPGAKRDDIDIELREGELVITGEIKERERKGIIRRQTRRVGRFEYRVRLPGQTDAEKVDASLNDGVLRVSVPKAEQAKARRIEISDGGQQGDGGS